jgi:sulfite reductase alpha subunit-like flavoprotein
MTAQPSPQFDISPMLKMYTESFELWKKNYETVMKTAKDPQGAFGANGAAQVTHAPAGSTSAADAALLKWQKSGEDLFKRFIQNQIELCNFFGSRWEHYLKLPEQLSQCRSLTEFGNLQSSFLSQFAKDYMHETETLAHPVAELITNWGGGKK